MNPAPSLYSMYETVKMNLSGVGLNVFNFNRREGAG